MSGPPVDQDAGREQLPSNSDQTKSIRDGSPARVARSVSAIPQLTRSRKNSQEFSPTRNNAMSGSLATVPSAAAVQRARSAQRPLLPPGSVDGAVEGTRADRPVRSGHNSPSWPTSPRLKSPPPSLVANRNASARKSENEQTPSNTSLKRLATISTPETGAAMQIPEGKELATHSGLRVPTRGASSQSGGLETVAESSVPSTPSIGPLFPPSVDSKIDVPSLDQQNEPQLETSTIKDGERNGDGVSKSNADKSDASRNSSATRPDTNLAKRSFTSLAPAKPKATESTRTMTVETEPVSTMAPLLVGERGVSSREGGGSVRTKPSSETIRPKKEKKKVPRKAPTSGTVTSKADIFEAKVATAVDEADSSDSDETFVYESNPPDNRPVRHHSRTPSATSLASQEQFGTRGKHGARNGSQAIGGKKSMKFSSSAYSNHYDGEGSADGRGSTRNTSTPRHHHIGRHGRAAHGSIFDADSPFTQANRANSPRTLAGNVPRSPRPNSPRIQNGRLPSGPRKGDQSTFDAYEDAADDERAPLMGSVRINRNRHSRRPNGSNFRNIEYGEMDDRTLCGRYGSCIFLVFIVTLISLGVATFVMALNQPLQDVSIRHIQNILASEQEIMLDLHVDAINTNLFAITVTELDVNLFAESPYVASSADWRTHHGDMRWAQRRRDDGVEGESLPWPFPPGGADDGVDEGTDPIDDPESGTQKMLLGRVLDFDSPLFFEASPMRRIHSSSVGEIRLAKPGNKTETGGSAKWERVLQHQFDLIVRGVIQYQLPLSSKVRSAKIASRAKVYPNNDDGSGDGDGNKPEL